MKKSWWRWLLIILWIGVIYCFSAQSGEISGNMSGGLTKWLLSHLVPQWEDLSMAARVELLATWRVVIRKGAHMTEFAVLAMLFFGAWRNGGERTIGRSALLTAPSCFIVAAADEFHQAFVPARGPSLRDVFIDFAGALLGILLISCIRLIISRCRRLKE